MNALKATLLCLGSTFLLGTGYAYLKNEQAAKEQAQADNIKKNTLAEYVEFRRQVENVLHDQPKKADKVATDLSGQFKDKHDETSIRLYHNFQGDKEMILIAETAYLYGNKYELRKDTLAVNTIK
jgi:hypothetical protein